MSSSRPSRPIALFRTPERPWSLIVAIALAVLVLLPLAILVAVLGATSGSSAGIVLGLVAGLVILLVGCVFVITMRQRYTVTTAGIEVASLLGTRRLPWSQIRLVRVGPATFRAPRATEIVLADGSTVRPPATSMNFAVWRGEMPTAHGADGTSPTRCTLAAFDAHRRYLAGEFGR
ncbi:PH domain-containing protein [Brachybacterium paraconglomeratum]|uniref:PH domain-containing protein n=1 Tax=Brachybacterium paraconglomeratum TaxID=173362 RepID=UPI0022E207EA|nr:PH domain-containing protein [Brachybacterium paraconglomeratum]